MNLHNLILLITQARKGKLLVLVSRCKKKLKKGKSSNKYVEYKQKPFLTPSSVATLVPSTDRILSIVFISAKVKRLKIESHVWETYSKHEPQNPLSECLVGICKSK